LTSPQAGRANAAGSAIKRADAHASPQASRENEFPLGGIFDRASRCRLPSKVRFASKAIYARMWNDEWPRTDIDGTADRASQVQIRSWRRG